MEMARSCLTVPRPLRGLAAVCRKDNTAERLGSGLPVACLRFSRVSPTVVAQSRRSTAVCGESTSETSHFVSSSLCATGGRLCLTVRRAQTYGAGKRRNKTLVTCQVAGAGIQNEGWDFAVPLSKDASIVQKVRAICFYATTFVVAAPLFIVMLVLHPFVLLFDKERRKAHHLVNKFWARTTTFPFYKTEITGWENLPSEDEGAVYVANHQSFLDIYTLFQLGRPFKFISKTSNFLIPIIGWAMYLTGHVSLQREDTKSQIECLKKCVDLVKNGVSVIFFPEGTRTSDGTMAAFKKGAFSIAAKAKAPVIPICLLGTGKLMPNQMEYTLRPGCVKVVIHPAIREGNPDELCAKTRAVIADTLVKHGLPVH